LKGVKAMKSLDRTSLATTASAIALSVAIGLGGVATAVAPAGAEEPPAVSIVRVPDDLPAPVERREARTVKVELEAVELLGQLDEGTTYRYWTFDGKVPGPMVRVRVGDTVEVTMKNREDSWMIHNVDFHAVTGPGGGAHATLTDPGGQTGFTLSPEARPVRLSLRDAHGRPAHRQWYVRDDPDGA
jgi:nitrite reductase (NO-forming)